MRSSTLTLLVLCSPLAAQLGGFDSTTRFDAQAKASAALGLVYDQMIGVARDAGGRYWVSCTRRSATSAHKLFRFASSGAFEASYDQPASTAASATGMLDLTYDSTSNVIYGGLDLAATGNKILAFDVASLAFNPAKDLAVPAGASLTTVRGLAYDPFGAAAAGTFYVADGASAIAEIGRGGNLIRTIPSAHPATRALAIDHTYRTLWAFGQGGTTKPNVGVCGIAVDMTSGQKNGQVVHGDATIAGSPPGGIVGGAEFVSYNHDHVVSLFAILTQSASDTMFEMGARLRYGATCGGTMGMTGDAPYAGNPAWQITLSGSAAGQAFVLLSASDAVVPVSPPLFALGCTLLVPISPAPIIVGPVPVVGGSAAFALPIPGGVSGGEVFFQWLEASVPFAAPLRFSDGGATRVF